MHIKTGKTKLIAIIVGAVVLLGVGTGAGILISKPKEEPVPANLVDFEQDETITIEELFSLSDTTKAYTIEFE